MLTDLAALTPPLLVAIAFLIAAGAFVRHEMRRAKSQGADEEASDSPADSSQSPGANDSDGSSAPRSLSENAADDPGRDDH